MLQQIDVLAKETAALEDTWNTTLFTFTAVASAFNSIVNYAIDYRDVLDAIYIGVVDLNISSPMFNGTFYDDVTVDTLAAKQGIALQFIQESNDDFDSVSNMFRARVAFYEMVNNEYNKSVGVDTMFNTIVVGLTFSASEQEVHMISLSRITLFSVRQQAEAGRGGGGG